MSDPEKDIREILDYDRAIDKMRKEIKTVLVQIGFALTADDLADLSGKHDIAVRDERFEWAVHVESGNVFFYLDLRGKPTLVYAGRMKGATIHSFHVRLPAADLVLTLREALPTFVRGMRELCEGMDVLDDHMRRVRRYQDTGSSELEAEPQQDDRILS